MPSKRSNVAPKAEQAPSDRPKDGWAAHEAEQRARWKGLTPAQRLEWLEQAKEFAAAAQAAAKRRNHGKDTK